MQQQLAAYAAMHPKQLLGQVKDTVDEMLAIDTHSAAVDFEFERQMWSVRQPEFKEALDAMKARISSKG